MQSRDRAATVVGRRAALTVAAGGLIVAAARPALAGLAPELAKEGWTEFPFKNKRPNSFTSAEGGTGVRLESRETVSLIYRPLEADLAATPVLAWRWRVDQAPPPTDLTKKGGDDRALAIYVAFAYDPARAGFVEKAKRAAASIASDRPLPGRVLIYTWGGDGKARGWFDSPYIRDFNKMKVLRGPDAPLGTWVEESVDLVADHQEAFGHPPSRPSELSLSGDSDDTKGPVAGTVADIAFRARG